MKRIFVLLAFLVLNNSFAQTPSLQQKLYYMAKVWGFAKYFHSNVSACNVNWDSVLLHVLPLVKTAATTADFNNALDTMLIAAGPMALSATYFPDTLAPELKRNRNFTWISDPVFSAGVQTVLDTIKNNFRPHPECSVVLGSSPGVNGYLSFPNDDPMLDSNTTIAYPDEDHRLLILFKFWNIINYFNPYNYVLDKPVDTILFNSIINIDTAVNATVFYNEIRKVTASLNDAHVEAFTYSGVGNSFLYIPNLMLRYIEGKYVVVISVIPGIPAGSAILSVDGKTTAQWEDSMKHYISAGNIAVLRRNMCEYGLLSNNTGSVAHIVYNDPAGVIDSADVVRYVFWSKYTPQVYYPADSIENIKWKTYPCGAGYINASNITTYTQKDSAYAHLHDAPSIIIDLRGSSDDEMFSLAFDMLSGTRPFANLLMPDVTYPGTFYWLHDSIGTEGMPTPYSGTVILLINEQTQSHAEFYCMEFAANTSATVIKIGSQTAGADGDVTLPRLTQDIYSGFTSIGVFYPNGDSTQRIGIVPDSFAYPTVAGILQHRDEVLEKALQIGCTTASVPHVSLANTSMKVYPNPASDKVFLEMTNMDNHIQKYSISLADITGRTVLRKDFDHNATANNPYLDIKSLIPGTYFVILCVENQKYITKVTKE